MSDQQLVEAWRVLEPAPATRGRLEEVVAARWEARSRSLVTEWLDLLRARPVVNGAWALAALVTVLVATPVGALAGLVPRALAGQVLVGRSTPVDPAAQVPARARSGPQNVDGARPSGRYGFRPEASHAPHRCRPDLALVAPRARRAATGE